MITEIKPNIFKIDVVLPQNPLKNLNSYVIKGSKRNLIIDTGFNRIECLQSIREGIEELDLDMGITDVFITHLHADHSGLVSQIVSNDSKIYMNSIDKRILDRSINESSVYWGELEERYILEGFPQEEVEKSRRLNPARNFVSKDIFEIVPIKEGNKLCYGDYEFVAIETPGHTPGHTCLYCEKEKLMFTGDHVLFGITPNITLWKDTPNSLGSYIESLKKIKKYDVKLALAGHREITGDFNQRIEALLLHHQNRLEDAYSIIEKNAGINAYNIASKMKWSIRAKNWDDFPVGQKWFAVGETMAHLNYLIAKNKIRKDNMNTYHIL